MLGKYISSGADDGGWRGLAADLLLRGRLTDGGGGLTDGGGGLTDGSGLTDGGGGLTVGGGLTDATSGCDMEDKYQRKGDRIRGVTQRS